MKPNLRILALSLLFGVAAWVLDALLDALFFQPSSFRDLLILDVPPHEIFTRLTYLVGFLALGLILPHLRGRREEAEGRRIALLEDLASVLAATSDAVLATDLEGRVTVFNPGAERLFGYAAEEMVGSPISRLCPPDLLDDQGRVFGRLKEGGPLRGFETVRLRKDGVRVPVEITANLQTDEGGNATGVVSVIRNIGERRERDRILRETEQRFRDLAELLPEAVFETDQRLNIAYANRRALDLFGYSQEELGKGLFSLDMLVPEDRERAAATFRTRIAGEDPGATEYRALRRDGSAFPVLFHAAPIRVGGEFAGLRGVLVDLTESKRAEEALRESEERLRNIIEHSTNVFYAHTPDHLLTYISPQIETLLGFTPEEALVRWTDLTTDHPRNRDGLKATERAISSGRSQPPYELELRRKDGGNVWVEVRETPVAEEGKTVAIVGALVDITDRMAVQEALRESHAELLQAQSIAQVGSWEIDLRSGAVTGTQEARRIYGLTGEQISLAGIQEVPLPRYRPILDRALTALVERGEPYDVVFEIRSASTEETRTVHSLARYDAAAGRVRGVIQDITDRVRAEKTLLESEATLRSIVRMAPTGIGLVRDRVLLEVNEVVCEMVGWDRETLIGQNARVLYPTQDDYEYVGTEKYRQIREHGSGTVETRWQHRDGHILQVLMSSTPIDPDDWSKGIAFTALDITERKRSEEALRASEERFRSVIEQSNDAVYIVVGKRFDLVNHRFCELTGVSREEATGPDFDFWSLLAPESIPLVRARQEKRARGEEVPGIYEFVVLHREGRRVHVEASTTAIEFGTQKAVLGTLRDVTEQKRMEAQLNLAQKIDAIGRLSGGVAHDLNNLLSPVLGYSEMLFDDFAPNDERRESVEQILQAGLRARELVRQLLAFSRKQTLEFRSVHLGPVVRNFEKLLRRTIREDIRIDLDLPPDLPTIRADVGQLEQVVMNLAVNAQDAMPDGGTLTIQTSLVEVGAAESAFYPGLEPGSYILMVVRDTGMGMDALTREKVFEPFFTTKEVGRGTGLGLATVYGIVKQHGGGIWVDSEPGRGASFRCYFPVAGADVPLPVPPRERRESPGGTEAIMVVEDERMVRTMTVRSLERMGYSVLAAESAEECLATLSGHTGALHLLLTDVVLPGMNGRALADEVRARFPGTRVLFMSGYSDDVVSHHGVLDEGIAFLHKPSSIHGLAAKIREVLDGP